MTKKSSQPSENKVSTTASKPTASAKQTAQGTIKSLLSSGKAQKCTYSSKLQSTSISGTVYVANGKMKGDFTTVSGENNINGHMNIDGKYFYVWTDLRNRGIKMALNQQQPTGAPSSSSNGTPDINQTFNYVCQGWTEDDTVFALPPTISFSMIEVPTLPSGTASPSSGTNSSTCSVCNNIPAGSARDACKTQLHCQ